MSFELHNRIGRGRTADVFGLSADRVLRRYRDGRDAMREAEVMKYLAASGYPVPEVFDASGPDIVMARLDGVTMRDALGRQPWPLRTMARLLADLQKQLNAIAPSIEMPVRFGEPKSILHLDFHPANIMLTSNGPVAIDFANVAAGPAGADVAQSWIIMATSSIPSSSLKQLIGDMGRCRFVHHFLLATDVVSARRLFVPVALARKRDPNVTKVEATRIDELVARVPAIQS